MDPVVKMEPCEIPKCPTEMRDFQAEHQETAMNISATDCECASELYGSSLTTADTSVPTWTGLVQKGQKIGDEGRQALPLQVRANQAWTCRILSVTWPQWSR